MPYLRVGSVSLHYEQSGRGAPLVLIPGWTLNTRLWDPVVPHLEGRHRVIRYDVRGAGRSSSDPALEYSRMADTEDLKGLLDHLEISRAGLVGHSKGARIAMTFAMRWPERTRGAVAVGSGEPRTTGGAATAFSPIVDAWLARLRETARREGPERAVEQLSRGRLFGPFRSSVEGIALLRRAMEGYGAADLLSTTPKRRFDALEAAPRLSVPVLILVGSEDPFLSECQTAHRLLPHSTLQIFSGAGHMLPLERPEPLSRAILDFFS